MPRSLVFLRAESQKKIYLRRPRIIKPAALNVGFSDSITFSDSFTKSPKKTVSDTLTFADVWSLKKLKVFSDTLALSDAWSKTIKTLLSKSFSQTLALSDAWTKSIMKPFSDTLALSDQFKIPKKTKYINETLALSDLFRVTKRKGFSDSMALSDVWSKSITSIISKPLSDTLTLTETFSKFTLVKPVFLKDITVVELIDIYEDN